MKILWDLEENLPAINWDGTPARIGADWAIVKCLRWYHAGSGDTDEREEWVDYRVADGVYGLFDKRQLRRFKRRFKEKAND